MADFIDWLKGDDYEAFARWVNLRFPYLASGLTKENWKQHRLYKQWVDTGRINPKSTEGSRTWTPIKEQYGPSLGIDKPLEDKPKKSLEPKDIEGLVVTPVAWDEDGNPIMWEYRADPTYQRGMSDYEKSLLDIQVQQLNAQTQKDYRERVDTQTWQRMLSDTSRLQNQQRMFGGEAENIQDWRNARQQFESQRGGGGGSPRDWINRYMAENAPNPYASRVGPSPTDVARDAVTISEQANKALIGRSFADPFSGVTSFGSPSPTVGYDDRQINLASKLAENVKRLEELTKAEKAKAQALNFVTNPNLVDKYGNSVWGDLTPEKRVSMQALGDSVRGGTGGGGERDWEVEARNRQRTLEAGAPVPQWMQPMTGVSRVTPQMKGSVNVPTPSGQQWGRLPYSQREQYAGFVDFAGNRPFADILDTMAMMQPGTPTGAKYAKVRPARQI